MRNEENPVMIFQPENWHNKHIKINVLGLRRYVMFVRRASSIKLNDSTHIHTRQKMTDIT